MRAFCIQHQIEHSTSVDSSSNSAFSGAAVVPSSQDTLVTRTNQIERNVTKIDINGKNEAISDTEKSVFIIKYVEILIQNKRGLINRPIHLNLCWTQDSSLNFIDMSCCFFGVMRHKLRSISRKILPVHNEAVPRRTKLSPSNHLCSKKIEIYG